MTEMDPSQSGIDRLMRNSMAATVPALAPDFDQRLMRNLTQNSHALARYRQILLITYGVVSVVVSAAVMRSQGLDWAPIAAMILGPLALVAAYPILASRFIRH